MLGILGPARLLPEGDSEAEKLELVMVEPAR